ncbi:MAG: glutathione S-transferase [Gammaproteobacteria bacterium]|nr:glutathione S-transferase [Gammaproteobacteria bacterium]MAY03617.1 glutathione S-transferase [Gammaproteobacteria bacterium]|tara:strand:+ start:297633 stop:298250 length:618 start_codon:yes stop_codon:yes gene_type:complete
MSDPIFYTNPMSRGRIVRWMLEEIGCEYQTEIVEYGEIMKGSAYLAINPMGKVPALSHQGKVVTETPAILCYLADAFPDAGLAPPPAERQAYYRWLFFAAGPLEAAVSNQSLGLEIPSDKQATIGYGSYAQTVEVLAAAVATGSYIAGDKFSAADIYLGAHIIWGTQFGTLPERPEFTEYKNLLTGREAYQRADELDNALIPEAP